MPKMSNKPNEPVPGDGIRSLRSTGLFRAVNFELYVKPNKAIMAIGLLAFGGCAGYIAYVRHQYSSLGYYSAVTSDGTEQFKKKVSKWS